MIFFGLAGCRVLGGTETHIGALDLAPKVQMRSRRRENVSKEVKITRGVSSH